MPSSPRELSAYKYLPRPRNAYLPPPLSLITASMKFLSTLLALSLTLTSSLSAPIAEEGAGDVSATALKKIVFPNYLGLSSAHYPSSPG